MCGQHVCLSGVARLDEVHRALLDRFPDHPGAVGRSHGRTRRQRSGDRSARQRGPNGGAGRHGARGSPLRHRARLAHLLAEPRRQRRCDHARLAPPGRRRGRRDPVAAPRSAALRTTGQLRLRGRGPAPHGPHRPGGLARGRAADVAGGRVLAGLRRHLHPRERQLRARRADGPVDRAGPVCWPALRALRGQAAGARDRADHRGRPRAPAPRRGGPARRRSRGPLLPRSTRHDRGGRTAAARAHRRRFRAACSGAGAP